MIKQTLLGATVILLAGCQTFNGSEQPLALNQQIDKCTHELPANRKYHLSYTREIDTSTTPAKTSGTFSFSWEPDHMPSEAQQEKEFKALEPFIKCISPALNSAPKAFDVEENK